VFILSSSDSAIAGLFLFLSKRLRKNKYSIFNSELGLLVFSWENAKVQILFKNLTLPTESAFTTLPSTTQVGSSSNSPGLHDVVYASMRSLVVSLPLTR
jgi:hypothetical protein